MDAVSAVGPVPARRNRGDSRGLTEPDAVKQLEGRRGEKNLPDPVALESGGSFAREHGKRKRYAQVQLNGLDAGGERSGLRGAAATLEGWGLLRRLIGMLGPVILAARTRRRFGRSPGVPG